MEHSKIVSRSVGTHLTESKVSSFEKAITEFAEFARISQFAKQPKHVSEVEDEFITHSPELYTGNILYGIDQDGYLIWLGQIVDSSD